MPEQISHILTIGVPVLVLLYCAVCAAALRPRTGTLAWIPDCDRPAPPLLGVSYPVEKRDFLLLAGICVLTCPLRAAGTMRPLADFFSLDPGPLALALLEYVAAPLAAAALAFLLMKLLFGRSFSAALCAALIAADFQTDSVSLAFSAASLFCFVCFLTGPEEPSVRRTLVPLAGGFVFLAAGCYFDPGLTLMLAAGVILCVMGCVERFVRTGKLWALPCLAAAFLSVALTWTGVFILGGLREGYAFPSMLAESEFYLMALRRLGSGFASLFRGEMAVAPPGDWPLLLAAFPALISAAVWLARRRDQRSALLLAWTLTQVLTFVLLGSHALSLGCAVCLCQVWSKLEENRFLWLACVGAGALAALLLIPYFLCTI